MDEGLWVVLVSGALAAGCLYLAARVPAVWSGAPSPIQGLAVGWYGKSRRTYLMYVLTVNAFFDGCFLLVAGMRFEVDPAWQAGTVVMAIGSPVMLLLWIVVAVFNRPRWLVPPDQRRRRKD